MQGIAATSKKLNQDDDDDTKSKMTDEMPAMESLNQAPAINDELQAIRKQLIHVSCFEIPERISEISVLSTPL